MAPPLATFALKFGPPEYFSLMCMGMVVLSFLTGASMVRSLMMACFGVIVGTVGMDTVSGSTRDRPVAVAAALQGRLRATTSPTGPSRPLRRPSPCANHDV